MRQSAVSSAQTPHCGYDPLDDLEVSALTERYFKVKAALGFLLRSKSSPERVFKLYALTEAELKWFSRAHPQEAEAWFQAYLLKSIKAALSGFFYYYRLQQGRAALGSSGFILPIPKHCCSFAKQFQAVF